MEFSRNFFLKQNKKTGIEDFSEPNIQGDKDIQYTTFNDNPNLQSPLLFFIFHYVW